MQLLNSDVLNKDLKRFVRGVLIDYNSDRSHNSYHWQDQLTIGRKLNSLEVGTQQVLCPLSIDLLEHQHSSREQLLEEIQ